VEYFSNGTLLLFKLSFYSERVVNNLIDNNVMSVLIPRLMKFLETLQHIMKSNKTIDCYELEWCKLVCKLLCNISKKNKNRRGDKYVTSCGVIPLLLELLQTLTSFRIKYGNTKMLEQTQLHILKCLVQVTRGCEDDFPNESVDSVIGDGVIQTLMDMLSSHLIQKKKNQECFSTQLIEHITNIIFNINMNGIIFFIKYK
jgi:hypothetical protein